MSSIAKRSCLTGVAALALGLALSTAHAAEPSPTALFPPGWDARLAKAERLLGPVIRRELGDVPVQRRFDPGNRPMLDPLVTPVWAADGQTFFYWAQDRSLKHAKPLAGRQEVLVEKARIAEILKQAGAPDAAKVSPEVVLVAGAPVLDFTLGGKIWRVDVAAGTAKPLEAKPSTVEGLALSRDGQAAAFVRDHDLYVRSPEGVERRITQDADLWYSFDPRFARSNPVNKVKPGPAGRPNVVWLPGAGHRLLVERWDFRKVGSNWMIDSLAKPRPKLFEQRIAVPGETELPRPEFWIVDADTGVSRRIDAGAWAFMGNMDVGGGGYFPAPDGRSLLFNRMTRDYGVVELVSLDLATGAERVLVRETNPNGSSIRYPIATFIEQGRAVLWKSDRSGRTQFWRVDLATGAARQVTKGDFSVEQVLHADDKTGRLYFSAYGDGEGGEADYPHTWSADMRTGKARRLDEADTAHVANFAPKGGYFLDTSSRVDRAPHAYVRSAADGKVLLDLGAADIAPLAKLGWRAPERVNVKGADGKTDIYGVMWKPTDFDPARKYPVVVQVYPGPYSEGFPVGFAPHQPNTALSEMGFVVVRLGQRGGSPVRDPAYARYSRTQGSVRDYPLADNRAALIALGADRPYMDLDRVGIIGESGGGFMTVAAMLAYPEFYKVGVAAAGNHDNLIYEMNSSEFYWGTPGKPGSASYDTVASQAAKLSGALLLVHGDQDDDVTLSSSVRLIDALNRAGKRYDFLLLPGASHFNFEPATSEYYRRRMWGFLVENLKPDVRP